MASQREQEDPSMITQSLSQAIFIIEKEQQDYPETYNCIEGDLDELKRHMNTIIKYIAPITEDDLCLTLPVLIEHKNSDNKKGRV